MSGILVRRHSIDNIADTNEVKIDDDFFTDAHRGHEDENEEAGGEKDQDEAAHPSSGLPAESNGRRANIENWRKVDSFGSSNGSIMQGNGSKGDTPGTTSPSSPAFASSDKNVRGSFEFEGKPHSSHLLQQGDGVNLECLGLSLRDAKGLLRNVKNAHASFDSNHSGRSSNMDGMPTIYSGHNTPTMALVPVPQRFALDPKP